MLFMLWGDQSHRPTRDVDFLGFGDSSETGLKTVFRELCEIPVEDDGLTLIADSIQVNAIRDDTEYGGMRVKLFGDLAGAKIPIQADIGFGDAVTPSPRSVEYPTLLDSPAPNLKAYPRETVVAEKYQALVKLGMATTSSSGIIKPGNRFSRFTDSVRRMLRRRKKKAGQPAPSGPRSL